MGNGRRVQYLITLCVSMVNVSVGSFGSWPATVIPKFHDRETGFQISDAEISWIVALPGIGMVTGNVLMRKMSNTVGRKLTLLASVIPLIVAVMILVLASKAYWLFVARFTCGISAGMTISISNVYLAEIADKEIRGSLSVVSRFMLNFGMFLTLAIGPLVSYKVLNWILLPLPLTGFFVCLWIPETPYFLLKKGKVDEAGKVLAKTRGHKSEMMRKDELSQMLSQVKSETRRSGSIKEFFTGKQYRKAIIISGGLTLFCGLSGQLVLHHYVGLIVKESQYDINLVTLLTVFGAVKFVVGIISSALVDRVGRRPLLMYSFLGTGITVGIVSVYFLLLDIVQVNRDILMRFSFIPFAGIIVSGIIANLGFISMISLIYAELFPLNVRTLATMLFQIFNGLLSFIVTKAYQPLKDLIGLCGVFFIYTVICLGGALFTLLIVSETKGKSLKEIQDLLQRNSYTNGHEDIKLEKEVKEMEKLMNQGGKVQIEVK